MCMYACRMLRIQFIWNCVDSASYSNKNIIVNRSNYEIMPLNWIEHTFTEINIRQKKKKKYCLRTLHPKLPPTCLYFILNLLSSTFKPMENSMWYILNLSPSKKTSTLSIRDTHFKYMYTWVVKWSKLISMSK